MKIAQFIQQKADKYDIGVTAKREPIGYAPGSMTVYRFSGFLENIQSFGRDEDVIKHGYEPLPGAQGAFYKK
jgi:hypothetical protein